MEKPRQKKPITGAAAPGEGINNFSPGAEPREENFELQIHRQRQEQKAATPGPLPGRSAGSDRLQVEISQVLLDELESFGKQETRTEQGALLLGRFSEGKQGLRVQVKAWVEARYANNQRANITFTHKTWEYLAEEQETHYPHLQVVGWFHTHPGFGIFLSRYDLFIHENFFRNPGQVALVYDPLKEALGLFCWNKGSIQRGEYQVVEKMPQLQGSTDHGRGQHPKTAEALGKKTGTGPSGKEAKASLLASCLFLAGTVLGAVFLTAVFRFLLRE